MECGGSYFVLAKIPHHVNPNNPGEDAHHHAFVVAPQEFDRALAIMKARGIELVKYSEEGHTTFPAVMPISTTPMATASRSSISTRHRSLPSDAPRRAGLEPTPSAPPPRG